MNQETYRQMGCSWLEALLYSRVSRWLKRSGAYDWIMTRIPNLHRYCRDLFGTEVPVNPSLFWLARLFVWELGMLGFGIVMTLFLADSGLIICFLILLIALPLAMWRDLTQKVASRHYAFASELPAFIHKVSLLLAAGETVQRAWVIAGAKASEKKAHPLYRELAKTNNELTQSMPFAKALEDLHHRCGVHEMSSFVTTVLMNYRRGGDSLAIALQETSRVLVERQYTLTRTRGEEASTKLIFPMVVMLAAVMVIIAAPAVMMMSL